MMVNQASVSVKLVNTAKWGGVLPYTVYELEIRSAIANETSKVTTLSPNHSKAPERGSLSSTATLSTDYQNKWKIYRRFSDFLKLHHELLRFYSADVLKSHGVDIDLEKEKEALGRGNRSAVVARRRQLLQVLLT